MTRVTEGDFYRMFFILFFFLFVPLSQFPFGISGGFQWFYFDKDPQTTCKRFQARTRWEPRCLPPAINVASG